MRWTMDQEYREEKGYLFPIEILSISEAADVRSSYHKWVSSLPDSKLIGDLRFKPHLHLPFINDIIYNERILSAVKGILGPNVLLWSSDFNMKAPKSDGFFPLHQDATYTGLSPAELGVTVWLAISDNVDEKSGCLTFIEGSHLHGQLVHVEEKSDPNNMLSRNQCVHISDDTCGGATTGRAVAASLKAGQASIHHFYLLHKSGPNQSEGPRIGLALRYIAASVKQMGKVREAVTLVAGKMEHDGFDLEPTLPRETAATDADIERGKAAHRDSMMREKANYFESADTIKAYDGADK